MTSVLPSLGPAMARRSGILYQRLGVVQACYACHILTLLRAGLPSL